MSLPRFRDALLCASGAWLLAGAWPAAADAGQDLVEQGRLIYQQGVLPDGSPLVGSQLSGAAAACVNCHRRSGYGSMEGRVIIPPIAGAVLFAPGPFAPKVSLPAEGPWHAQVERFRARAAYDEASLERALRDGVDPDGARLVPPMQRFALDAKAVSALDAYLRHLSDRTVPGIDGETMHLGTVIAPDVPPSRREALLDVLRAFAVDQAQWGMKWRIHVWQLSGPPAGWVAQLDAYYRQQPVFALLSGAGTAEWSPVQGFCERNAVACVLPSLEVAPELDGSYYSFYFSPGLTLEARLLVHHLVAAAHRPRRLIQVVEDDSGRRAATVVRGRLDGARDLEVVQMAPDEFAATSFSDQDAAMLWLRPSSVARLGARMSVASLPGRLFLSALLTDPADASVATAWKGRLRYLSLFDPQADRRAEVGLRPWLARHGLEGTDLRLRADTYAACNFFNAALAAVKLQSSRGVRGALTRERVLEAMESVMTVFRDDGAPFYWQLTLGPGQRTPVRGGMVLRYASPDSSDLVAVEQRIVP